MKAITKEEKQSRIDLLGQHLEKHYILLIIMLAIVASAELAMILFWFIDPTEYYTATSETIYQTCQFAHLFLAIGLLVAVILNKKKIIKAKLLVILFHIYAVLLMAFATLICIMDLSIGLPPITFILIATMISGLFVVEPFFFMLVTLASYLTIIIFQIVNNYEYFNGTDFAENVVNLTVYVGLVIVIAFRRFSAIIAEQKEANKLEKLAHYDELTDLLNERSYLNEIDEINQCIKKGESGNFAVILMDVNNLKVTNDAYGHRYGCHLIVRCGHILPLIFKTSKLFHVGGDEFIVVVYGEDFEHFEERIKTFDEMCRYTKIEYEGHELIFSVARGYAIHQEGQLFKDVLQLADNAMYQNKIEIKATYNMKVR